MSSTQAIDRTPAGRRKTVASVCAAALLGGLSLALSIDATVLANEDRPAEIFYRGKQMKSGFGQRPAPQDELAQPSPDEAQAVEDPPAAANDDVPTATEAARALEPRDLDASQAQPLPPRMAFPQPPVFEADVQRAPYWFHFQPRNSGTRDDAHVRQAAAVERLNMGTAEDEPQRNARIHLEPPPTSLFGPVVVTVVVATVTTTSTMLLVALLLTRRFRDSVFRVEVSNAGAFAHHIGPPAQDGQLSLPTASNSRGGVAKDLADLPMGPLLAKTYHDEQMEEAERRQEITDSMMASLFEENLKLRDELRDGSESSSEFHD